MESGLTAWISIGLSSIAAILAVFACRGVSFREWRSLAFWIPPVVIVWPSIALILGALPIASGVFRGDVVVFGLQVMPSVLVCLLLMARAVVERKRVGGVSALIVSAVVLVGGVFSVVAGQSLLHALVALAVVAGCAFVRNREARAIADALVISVAGMCVLLASYGLLLPGLAVRTDCQQNTAKCDLLGGFLSIGQESGSNAFGITLAMVAAFAVYRLRWSRAVMLTAAVCATILASGARLATACAAASCAIGLLAKARGGRTWAAVALSAATVASLIFAVVPFPPHSFTDRAILWGRARQMILDAPWFGHGLSFWVRDAATQPPPPRSYSPHNLWLDLGVAGGMIAVLVLVVAVLLGLWLSAPEARTGALLILTGIVVVGCFESTFMPFRINPVPAGMVVLLAYLSVNQRTGRLRGLLRRLGRAPAA